jgi:hypothetical protein
VREQSSARPPAIRVPLCEANEPLADTPFTGPVRRPAHRLPWRRLRDRRPQANGRASALPGTRITTTGPLGAGEEAHRRIQPRCKPPPGSESPPLTRQPDRTKRELRLLIGERLHHRTEAKELLWVVDADTSFLLPLAFARMNKRPATQGTEARACCYVNPRVCDHVRAAVVGTADVASGDRLRWGEVQAVTGTSWSGLVSGSGLASTVTL